MATFQAQVTGLTSITISSSGTNPTEAQLSQFLTDGAKEVINNFSDRLMTLSASSQTFTSGTANTLNTGNILSVFRNDGDIEQPCRRISSSLKGRASDRSEMIYASVTDPVYFIANNTIDILPENGVCSYSEVQYPTVLYSESAIAVFPDEAEYLVVLYGAIKSLQNVLSSKASNADINIALTAINTELDELPAIADLINTQINAAVTQLGESAIQVDSSVDTALSAITTAAGRINTAVALANTQFDSAVTATNSSNEDIELASSHVNVGNGFLSEASASSTEVQSYIGEVNSRISQVSGYNQVINGYINAAQGYANEIQSKIAIASGYGNEISARLSVDTTHYSFYEKQQAKLQQDYDKGLAQLKG